MAQFYSSNMLRTVLFIPIQIISAGSDLLASATRWIGALFFSVEDDDYEMLENDGRPGIFARLGRKLRRSRRRMLLLALLLFIVGTIGFVVFREGRGYKQRVAKRYQIALADALNEENFKEADLLRRKLSQLGIESEASDFLNALAAAKRGNMGDAYQQMQQIASPDQPGYPNAHFWQAKHLIDGEIDLPKEEAMNLALQHLKQVKTRTAKLARLHYMQGIAYAKLDQNKEAIESLQQAKEIPAADALLLELHFANGDMEKAKANAVAVKSQLSRLESKGEKLTAVEHKWRTNAAKVLGDRELEAQAVMQWYESDPENLDAKMSLAIVHLRTVGKWLDEVDDRWLDDDQQMPVEQLIQASNLVPEKEYDRVRSVLLRIWKMKEQSQTIQKYYDRLITASENKDANKQSLSGKALEFFGTSAATESDWALADKLLGMATDANPDWSHAWNNRAFVLGEGFPDRWKEALGYANEAISLEAENANFRETRGMLKVKLKSWEAAILDLEFALNGLAGKRRAIHEALSKAHQQLGNSRLADMHQKAAN